MTNSPRKLSAERPRLIGSFDRQSSGRSVPGYGRGRKMRARIRGSKPIGIVEPRGLVTFHPGDAPYAHKKTGADETGVHPCFLIPELHP